MVSLWLQEVKNTVLQETHYLNRMCISSAFFPALTTAPLLDHWVLIRKEQICGEKVSRSAYRHVLKWIHGLMFAVQSSSTFVFSLPKLTWEPGEMDYSRYYLPWSRLFVLLSDIFSSDSYRSHLFLLRSLWSRWQTRTLNNMFLHWNVHLSP